MPVFGCDLALGSRVVLAVTATMIRVKKVWFSITCYVGCASIIVP